MANEKIDIELATEEFFHLKQQNLERNNRYWLNRQAVKGNFRWPVDWPKHIPQVTHNLCRPIVERFGTYLMGKGFNWNLDRPNSEEFREAAEQTEKILRRILELSESPLQWQEGAKLGSELGRTVFKVYRKGQNGRQHACFQAAQPDYFYPIFAGDDFVTGDLATVYYSYPIDLLEARRRYGNHDYESEENVQENQRYDRLRERLRQEGNRELLQRRIPVLECWTPQSYALIVGGVKIYNGPNPNVWSDTKEGFIPFVVIENIRNAGEGEGEGDIEQARALNESLNWVLSRKMHTVMRYLTPTVVWEGAPPNYAEILADSLKGGGGIPTRIGSRISLLTYDREPAAVAQLEATLRQALLESAGMNEIALQGVTSGSVNTGPALAAQFQPVISTVDKKRLGWEAGIKKLFAMLLQVQEDIGDSKALGQAVINEVVASQDNPDGQLVELSGKMIKGLRTVSLQWPGVLPKDDSESARLEMEKASQGLQSIYTTMEKLGTEYPNDELQRIRMESQDPGVRPDIVSQQMRAEAPYAKMQQDAAMQQGPPGGAPPGGGGMPMPGGMEAPPSDPRMEESFGSGMELRTMLRELAKQSAAKPVEEEGQPGGMVLESPLPMGADA